MKILVFIAGKYYTSPYMQIIPALEALGHEVVPWDLSLQWAQESSFGQQSLEIKMVWSNRLRQLIDGGNFDLMISESDQALATFQMIEQGDSVSSDLATFGVKNCIIWHTSPLYCRNGQLIPMAEKGLFDTDNFTHLVADRTTVWELENILKINPEHIRYTPLCVEMDAQCREDFPPFEKRAYDVAFFSTQDLLPETIALISNGAGLTEVVMGTAFRARRMFGNFAQQLVPSVQESFIKLGDEYIKQFKLNPFVDFASVFAQKMDDFADLAYFFNMSPKFYLQFLMLERELKNAIAPAIAVFLHERFNTIVYAPASWKKIGINFKDMFKAEEFAPAVRDARICVAFNQRSECSLLAYQTLCAVGAPCVCVASERPENADLFSIPEELETFGSLPELEEKITRILADGQGWERILHTGMDALERKNTMQKRLKEILG